MTPRATQRSEPGEVQRLVLRVRPQISGLFAAHEIPSAESGSILRDSVDRAIQHCHRTDRPQQLFLRLLEDRCAAYARARDAKNEAEEGEDEDRPPDA